MIPSVLKLPLRYISIAALERRTVRYIENLRRQKLHLAQPDHFSFVELRRKTLGFVDSMKTDESGFRFRHSASCSVPTLYAAAYACMTYSLLGELRAIEDAKKTAWLQYLDSFQSPGDGLFYDPAVASDIYADSDWWGARHLTLHMISAYTDLGGRPRYPFKFLSPYCDRDYIKNWLDGHNWETNEIGLGDIDNKIMNIGCLLQYQRDQWADSAAGDGIGYLKEYLLRKINPATGLWGGFNTEIPEQRSRMVQFAYHLFPLFFYDAYFNFDHNKIVELALHTQNRIGGCGVRLNSSACEDIDSVDILIRLAPHAPDQSAKIDAALSKALGWVLCNQGDDGGFVFRLFEPFAYGHEATSSGRDEGGLMPTWFRTLSLAYMAKYLSVSDEFVIRRCPGYEF